MKINQYCSVCKKHLDMEVIPTDDGGDDGVIWLRCPECQGFLPKFTGEGLAETPAAAADPVVADPPAESPTSSPADASSVATPEPATDVPATGGHADPAVDGETKKVAGKDDEPAAPAEPVEEYAALLADADTTTAKPYRPSSSYDVGDVVLHLAYDDVGIVVAKETLPGGRKAVKVFFDAAGVVHLIEQAADGH